MEEMMEFVINNEDWKIKLVDKDTLKKRYDEENGTDSTFVFGLTIYPEQEIWINKDMCDDQQMRTLWRELTHCYIWSFGLNNAPHYTEEMVCDIVAASHEIIDDIIENFYLNKKSK